jgi:hypothetical protein
MRVFVLEMEHPFQGSNRLSVHKTKAGADARAAELVNLITSEIFEIFGDEFEEAEPQVATAENWEEIEDRYSKQEWVQPDGWGRWGGFIEEVELEE